MKNMNLYQPILLFDGECGLCQKSIQFMLKHEKNNKLKFASLHSDKIKHILNTKPLKQYANLDKTMILIENNKIYTQSDAALQLIKYLNHNFKLFYISYGIPKFFRNKIYQWIAKHRQVFFKSNECELSSFGSTSTRFL